MLTTHLRETVLRPAQRLVTEKPIPVLAAAALLLVFTLPLRGQMIGQGALAIEMLAILTMTVVALAGRRGAALDSVTGLMRREGAIDLLDRSLARYQQRDRTMALVLEVDRFKLLEERHDRAAVEDILRTVAARLAPLVGPGDGAARLSGASFVLALGGPDRMDLDGAMQIAGAVQRSMAEPVTVDSLRVHVTVSMGFSLAERLENPSGETLLHAATSALIEAQRHGTAAIRSYSPAMRDRIASRSSLSGQVGGALDRGEIMAFFQPQVSTRTGAITGFETLARWHHPARGLIPPVEFLPALEQAGMMGRLGEQMVTDALKALVAWDAAKFDIPRVGVNFSNEELGDPRLVERIAAQIDSYGMTPDRLVIEVLETVVAARAEDVVIRNLSGLARLGCCLDLDDFGTGHASITNIRRFSIERIKIDRSFVTRIDEDPEQQKMVGAILTMAERLGLDTLAEGVETAGEHAMLSRLGCGHVQGFGIARPMPMDETEAWIAAYQNRKTDALPFKRRAG